MKNLITLPKIILSLALLIFVIVIGYKAVETAEINGEPETLYGFSKIKIQGDTMRRNIIKNSYIKLYDEYNQVAKTANGIIDAAITAINNNSSKEKYNFIPIAINKDLIPKIVSLNKKIYDSSSIKKISPSNINFEAKVDVNRLIEPLLKDKNIDIKKDYMKKLDSYKWQTIN